MHDDDLYPAPKPEVHAEALEILGNVLSWHLPPERWAQAQQLIDTVTVATASGDLSSMTHAITDLELLGPMRIVRIGDPAEGRLVPPPDPVRERVNRLIHALGQPTPPDPGPSSPQPGDHDE